MSVRDVIRPARWITLSFLLAFFCTQISAAGILTGLVAYYPFDGNLEDASINGRDLAPCCGGAPNGFGSGRFGQALQMFHNSGGQAPVRDGSAFDFGSGDFTMQAWASFADLTSVEILMDHSAGDSSDYFKYPGGSGWSFFAEPGAIGFYNGNSVTGSLTVQPDRWYQLIAERSGGDLSLYADGVLLGSGTIGSTTSGAEFDIGRVSYTTGYMFGGELDDVAIWNRALSPDEIGYLSANSLDATPEPRTVSLLVIGGLLLVWKKRFGAKPGPNAA